MAKRIKPIYENVSGEKHPDFKRERTEVSEYYRLYASGKIDKVPESTRPTLPDDTRSVDQMLDDGSLEPSLGTDAVEVIEQLRSNAGKYSAANEKVQSALSDKALYDEALKVLNSPTATDDEKAKAKAYAVDYEKTTRAKSKRVRKS